jgi:hypothetical protein
MTYTRQQWTVAFIQGAGNNNPSPDVIKWVQSWTQMETGFPPSAAYNLLNTTEPNTPGVVSDFNSAGVKNYDTFAHGIQANTKVLANGLYPVLNASIKDNDIHALQTSSSINDELDIWGTKRVQATINNLTPNNDSFPGDIIMVTDNSLAEMEYSACGKKWWNSGIQQSWLQSYIAGIFYGPALCDEYSADGNKVQHFAGGTCKWNDVTGPVWRKNV